MNENRRSNVDIETRDYLDQFKKDLNLDQLKKDIIGLLKDSEDRMKDIIGDKIEAMGSHLVTNSISIKDHDNKVGTIQVDIARLEGRVGILEDNKDTNQKQAAIEPKAKANIISGISVLIGICGVLFGILKG